MATNKVVDRAYLLNQFKNYHRTLVTAKVQDLESTLNTKVDKVTGYGLSKNDFTDELKNKLDGLSNYDDTAVRALIQANASAIDTLNGDSKTEGSVAKTVETRVQEIINGAPESLDTLKEISDWIDEHGNAATAMNGRIATNASDIANLQEAQNNMDYEYETTPIDFTSLESLSLEITLTGPNTVAVGKDITLTSDVGGVSWSSNDDGKATVVDGVVHGVSEGEVTITASLNGYTAGTKVITVTSAVEG